MRLIDADDLKNKIIDLLEIEWGYDGIREDVSKIIDNVPTVELKNPDWETITTRNKRTGKKETYVFCPCCGTSYYKEEGDPE